MKLKDSHFFQGWVLMKHIAKHLANSSSGVVFTFVGHLFIEEIISWELMQPKNYLQCVCVCVYMCVWCACVCVCVCVCVGASASAAARVSLCDDGREFG